MKSVVFDFDFTLADSSPGVVACFGHAFERMGLRACAPEAIRATIGLSLGAAVAQLQGPQPHAAVQEFTHHFMQRADEVMVESTTLFPLARRTLEQVRARGHRIGIVSTKYRRRIAEVLARNGLAEAVDVIIGGEDTPVHKPDPTGLRMARERLLGETAPAVYVGDHPVDAQAAAAADFGFIAVLTGVHDRAAFAGYRPLAVLEDLERLTYALG